MKVKRFLAQDMRRALARIREEMGADAVILSNRTLDEGVEVVAASLTDQPEAPSTMSAAKSPTGRSASGNSTEDYAAAIQAAVDRSHQRAAAERTAGERAAAEKSSLQAPPQKQAQVSGSRPLVDAHRGQARSHKLQSDLRPLPDADTSPSSASISGVAAGSSSRYARA